MSDSKIHFSDVAFFSNAAEIPLSKITSQEGTEFFHVSMSAVEFLEFWYPDLFPRGNMSQNENITNKKRQPND